MPNLTADAFWRNFYTNDWPLIQKDWLKKLKVNPGHTYRYYDTSLNFVKITSDMPKAEIERIANERYANLQKIKVD